MQTSPRRATLLLFLIVILLPKQAMHLDWGWEWLHRQFWQELETLLPTPQSIGGEYLIYSLK